MGDSATLLALAEAASLSADDEDMAAETAGLGGRESSAARCLSTDNMDVQRQERVATTPDNHVAKATEAARKRLHCLIPITLPTQAQSEPSILRLP